MDMCNECVMNKADSNWKRTVNVCLVRPITGFEHVPKCLTDLPNINTHGMDTDSVRFSSVLPIWYDVTGTLL